MPLFTKFLIACVIASLAGCTQNENTATLEEVTTFQAIEAVSLSSNALVFDGTKVVFPTTLLKLAPILGEPRRGRAGLRNSYIWDDHGFVALTTEADSLFATGAQIESFSVFVVDQFFFKGDHLHPRNKYSGQLRLPQLIESGDTIGSETECTILTNNGFTESKSVLSGEPFFFAVTDQENELRKTRFSVQTEQYGVVVIAVEHDFDPGLLPF